MKILKSNIPIYLISLWCAIEFIISPYPYYGKNNGVFPTIRVGELSFDLSEIVVYAFIGYSLVLLFYKMLHSKQKISLGFGYNKYFVLSFIFVLTSSIFIGFVFRGSEFMTMIRVQIILLLYIIFMNLYDMKSIIKFIVKLLYWVGIINIFIYFGSVLGYNLYKLTIYPDLLTYIVNMRWGMFITAFSYSILVNKIIIGNSSYMDYILILLILIAVILNITAKDIVLIMSFATFSTFLFYFNNNIKRFKIIIISLLLILLPIFIYQTMNNEQKTLLIYTFSNRFFKAPAYDLNDLVENIENIHSGGSRDISAGRFDIWDIYFTGVSDTPIVSDNYGYKVNIHTDSLNHEGIAAHNSIMHYTYYAGYIAGFSLLFIILYFIRTTFSYRKRLNYYSIAKRYNVKEYEFYGVLTFIYAIIGEEMVSGTLSNAKFSWFWWLLVVFVLKVISESKQKNRRIC